MAGGYGDGLYGDWGYGVFEPAFDPVVLSVRATAVALTAATAVMAMSTSTPEATTNLEVRTAGAIAVVVQPALTVVASTEAFSSETQ